LNETAHEHDENRVALAESGTLDMQKDWIGYLLQTQGTDIHPHERHYIIAGEDNRFVFQGVHMLFDGTRDRPWKPNETRKMRWCSLVATWTQPSY